MDDIKLKEALNPVSHTVRAAQFMTYAGVGAMVEFPDQILMTAAPEAWQEDVAKIHDERLEKVLHVDYFGLPIDADNGKQNRRVAYTRFPEWYSCPICNRLQPLSKWLEDYRRYGPGKQRESDPYMVKHMRCPKCRAELVVARIVTICQHGHIADFPWVKWVHYKNLRGKKEICDHPQLSIRTGQSAASGLEGIRVQCDTCKASATLKGALDPNVLEELDEKYGFREFRCEGKHPWKHQQEPCTEHPRAVMRGASSVYYPVILSSLIVPPYTNQLNSRIEGSKSYDDNIKIYERYEKKGRKDDIIELIGDAAKEIQQEIGTAHGSVEDIKAILSRKWLSDVRDEIDGFDDMHYRLEEYEAMDGTAKGMVESVGGDFIREEQDIAAYHIPFLDKLVLIKKLKELRALVGFSRVQPVAGMGSQGFVSIKESDTRWYPGYEVRGEGIFFAFDGNGIEEWERGNVAIQRRIEMLQRNYDASFIGKQHPRHMTAKFVLLHSLAHLLIKQLSFECGYSIASLRERIYCDDGQEDIHMAGILIYTASGDSEGTLGGLVRQGYPDSLDRIFSDAVDSARQCSNDPVCGLSQGQGRDSLNLAACHACMLLPETCCEGYNSFLDRGVVAGTMQEPAIGLFSSFSF